MQIITALPPNFEAIRAVFPNAADPGVLFCYGDTIFNPSGDYVPPQLIAHEEVHSARQALCGPVEWWASYLVNDSFRFDEELAAHIVEYHDFIKRTKNRQMRRDYLRAIGGRLSGPLYGSACSLAQAISAIELGRMPG